MDSRPKTSAEMFLAAANVATICQITTLKECVSTRTLYAIFLSFVKPQNRFMISIIAQWIKSVIHSAGTDASATNFNHFVCIPSGKHIDLQFEPYM